MNKDLELLLSHTMSHRHLYSNAHKTVNGVLTVDLIKQYGPSAPYHMAKYGHLDNMGTPGGAKKGNHNARRYIIEGKSIAEWAKTLNVSRPRVTIWFKRHGTMKGCVPGKAGGWNKGKSMTARDTKSILKQIETRKRNAKPVSAETREKLRQVQIKRWAKVKKNI